MIAEAKRPRKKTKRLLKKLVDEISAAVMTEVGVAHLTKTERESYVLTKSPSRAYTGWQERSDLLYKGQRRARIKDLWTESKGHCDLVLAWVDKWASDDLKTKIHEALAEKSLMEPTPAVLANRAAKLAKRQRLADELSQMAKRHGCYVDFLQEYQVWCKEMDSRDTPRPHDVDPDKYTASPDQLIKLWEDQTGMRFEDQLKIGGARAEPGISVTEWEKLSDEAADPDQVAVVDIMYSGGDLYHNAPSGFHDEFGEKFQTRFDARPGASLKAWWSYIGKDKSPAAEFRHWLDIFKTVGFRQLGGLYHDDDVAIVAWLAWEGVGLRLRVLSGDKRFEIGVAPMPYAVREHHARHTPRLF